ncbi:bifunctional D-glycero-beta-D-manno-heptose-7-phosphate kinase/D-glycero-beta-D-manno-heptose 1-phosphate adenylyltransferase HldE [Aliiglaciecola sp. CAU 1673]|uniref:bifunctional D-glycero-beta-D-manno-heptose-7-phosphate kinase/D-glycero-beta-D-manno-heptose 1-phosphate adenylyltransferase HldE n=1 Tax=Aliiglaciecola sp. CAU 1673 TaxID=3032595 RepID=UPI0023DAA33D|nr:bifunctional D-glycero-beta-D-manno-heptose-7-phosphate kinase/D-glycero-beta-D-manno-heptose 1-phosphate adenylyltransferase HldE [Aliiglaciecola sp. CAU 1673]MDF2180037.1 bifunctional D-glycero-beta-D-manno-heptose-7-phosphate kinase/D-glycero-beta-D-manno-heptose 1-phosphate adenylyltransferase HldE [Aliiglaciecola sp. CAU 1673]
MQLPDFSRARVLVVGDIMLDRYWSGSTGRISPEAPVPVVRIQHDEERPGGAANVALNLAALGVNVTLVGMTGNDAAADSLNQKLEAVGIGCHFVRMAGMDTITKLRVLSRNQQLIRLDFEQSFAKADKQALQAKVTALMDQHDLLLLSDYDKGCLSDVQALIHTARAAGKSVVVDPKGSDFHKYRGASLLTPNMAEFTQIAGDCEDEQSLVTKAEKMMADLGLQALLVTRSEQGMTLLQPGQGELHLPAKAKEVFDVTGAGDTVIATLAGAVASGEDWPQACMLANAAAGIVVGKLGTSSVSLSELTLAISQEQNIGRGVMSEQQIKIAVEAAKLRGEKVVMTNGCFDILHAGHVSYLENARKLGDRLIVAVNDDASVRRLKGPGRPVNNTDRRMSVLAALASVDWVFAFSEDTPERVISEILPDILVKGGDYKPEEIAGSKQVWANGGEVMVLNFEDGISTTRIIERLRQSD